MKRFLPLAAAVVSLTVVGLIAVVAVGASNDDPASERQAEDTGGAAAACLEAAAECNDTVEGDDARCSDGAPDCVDVPVSGGAMNTCAAAPDSPGADPIAAPECNDIIDCQTAADAACSDLPADPGIPIDPICVDDGSGECRDTPGEAPPSGPAGTYDLTIVFTESVTQTDIDETIKIITGISPDTEFLVRESFPPVGVARITTSMVEFCTDIEAKLESASYIGDVTCAFTTTTDANPPADPDAPVSSEPGSVPGSSPIE